MKTEKVRVHLKKGGQKMLLGPKVGAATTVVSTNK